MIPKFARLPLMPVFQLDHRVEFPPAELADPDGLIAVGGDLTPERLVAAYAGGIFPWPTDGMPLLWHSPNPRFVLTTDALHIPKSLRKVIKRGRFRCTLDSAFRRVMKACQARNRPEQDGTWITDEMVAGYCLLHQQGLAHAVEVWRGDDLVGGLYGVSLGGAFFGESMFSVESDASKVGFVTLVQQLRRWGIDLIDAQVHTDHLARFGAEHWPRERFLAALSNALTAPTRLGPWSFDATS